jgi:hypothetical protein
MASQTVNLSKVVPAVPREIGCEEFGTLINPVQSTKFWPVRVQDNSVGASLFNANPVVRKTILSSQCRTSQQ